MHSRSGVAIALAVVLATASSNFADAQSGRSATLCDSYARDYANRSSRQGQVLGGAAKGGLIGLGIGSITGSAGVGAAIGAGIGVIGGGARRRNDADRMYNAAYQDCMAGRVR